MSRGRPSKDKLASMTPLLLRRAALLGTAAIGMSACDLAEFVADPAPRFEQTWSVPAPGHALSVAELLPTSGDITILPDSSAFAMSIAGANFSERVGDDCASCQALNGQNAPKPEFTLTAASGSPLPADVASATIVGGEIVVTLTNNMSFDPLRPRNAPGATQGYLRLLIHSGSFVLGRDSINGADTPWLPGTDLVMTIPFATGAITTDITVDVDMFSPQGDHNVPIDANGTMSAVADVQNLHVASVALNVASNPISSEPDTLDLADIDAAITDNVVSGTLEMTVTNPFAITGTVDMRFAYGPAPGEVVVKSFALPTGTDQVVTVTLTQADLNSLFGNEVALEITGAVSSSGPITVTPTMAISIENRLVLVIRTGEAN